MFTIMLLTLTSSTGLGNISFVICSGMTYTISTTLADSLMPSASMGGDCPKLSPATAAAEQPDNPAMSKNLVILCIFSS
jgi:hypothetical protein